MIRTASEIKKHVSNNKLHRLIGMERSYVNVKNSKIVHRNFIFSSKAKN